MPKKTRFHFYTMLRTTSGTQPTSRTSFFITNQFHLLCILLFTIDNNLLFSEAFNATNHADTNVITMAIKQLKAKFIKVSAVKYSNLTNMGSGKATNVIQNTGSNTLLIIDLKEYPICLRQKRKRAIPERPENMIVI